MEFLYLSSSPIILVDPRNGFILLSPLQQLSPQGSCMFFLCPIGKGENMVISLHDCHKTVFIADLDEIMLPPFT